MSHDLTFTPEFLLRKIQNSLPRGGTNDVPDSNTIDYYDINGLSSTVVKDLLKLTPHETTTITEGEDTLPVSQYSNYVSQMVRSLSALSAADLPPDQTHTLSESSLQSSLIAITSTIPKVSNVVNKKYPGDFLSKILIENFDEIHEFNLTYPNISVTSHMTKFLVNLIYSLNFWEVYHLIYLLSPNFKKFLSLLDFSVYDTPFGDLIKPPRNYLVHSMYQGFQYPFPYPFYNYSYHHLGDNIFQKYSKVKIKPYIDITLKNIEISTPVRNRKSLAAKKKRLPKPSVAKPKRGRPGRKPKKSVRLQERSKDPESDHELEHGPNQNNETEPEPELEPELDQGVGHVHATKSDSVFKQESEPIPQQSLPPSPQYADEQTQKQVASGLQQTNKSDQHHIQPQQEVQIEIQRNDSQTKIPEWNTDAYKVPALETKVDHQNSITLQNQSQVLPQGQIPFQPVPFGHQPATPGMFPPPQDMQISREQQAQYSQFPVLPRVNYQFPTSQQSAQMLQSPGKNATTLGGENSSPTNASYNNAFPLQQPVQYFPPPPATSGKDTSTVPQSSPLSDTQQGSPQSNHPPMAQRSPSIEQKSAPVEQRSAPVEQRSAPVEQRSAPVEQKSPPVEQKSPPIEQKSPPIEQKSPPIEQKSPPIEQKSSPIEQRSPLRSETHVTGITSEPIKRDAINEDDDLQNIDQASPQGEEGLVSEAQIRESQIRDQEDESGETLQMMMQDGMNEELRDSDEYSDEYSDDDISYEKGTRNPDAPHKQFKSKQSVIHQCHLLDPNSYTPCLKIFYGKNELLRHQEFVHATRKKIYKCVYCTRTGNKVQSYPRHDSLARHIRRKHGITGKENKLAVNYAKENVEIIEDPNRTTQSELLEIATRPLPHPQFLNPDYTLKSNYTGFLLFNTREKPSGKKKDEQVYELGEEPDYSMRPDREESASGLPQAQGLAPGPVAVHAPPEPGQIPSQLPASSQAQSPVLPRALGHPDNEQNRPSFAPSFAARPPPPNLPAPNVARFDYNNFQAPQFQGPVANFMGNVSMSPPSQLQSLLHHGPPPPQLAFNQQRGPPPPINQNLPPPPLNNRKGSIPALLRHGYLNVPPQYPQPHFQASPPQTSPYSQHASPQPPKNNTGNQDPSYPIMSFAHNYYNKK